MKLLKIFIPGDFEDAFVYMGHLLVLTAEHSLRFYDLGRLVASIEDKREPLGGILTYLFLRNDWLASDQFQTLLKNAALQQSVEDIARDAPILFEPSKPAEALELERDLQVGDGPVLDIEIYNQRIYFAAGNGFYHCDLDWSSLSDSDLSAPVKRHDARSISSNSGYGTVNISCGNEGLFSAYDEFGWSGSSANGTFYKTADRSVRSLWFARDLMNYSTTTDPVLLESDEEVVTPRGSERETRVLTSIGVRKFEFDHLFGEALIREDEQGAEVEFVFNSNNYLFLHTSTGHFLVMGVKRAEGEPPEIRYTRSHGIRRAEILGMRSSRTGVVVETETAILLFHEGNWHTVHKGEVLTVRTFPRSKRYKNLIVVTTEKGVTLLSPAVFANPS
jgi:hypothetical protein